MLACTLILTAIVAGSPDHGPLDGLLKQHVHDHRVDYAGLSKNRSGLEAYVNSLADVDVDSLSPSEEQALFINAYNACTLLLIVEHDGPSLKSITDIPEAKRWKHKRWNVGGEIYSLDGIEHEVLRPKFKDPRIHAAVNCASIGCPDLRAEAFTAENLDRQLDEQFRRFINDKRHVRVTGGKLHVSAIFNWFKNDFTLDGDSVVGWINRYADPDLRAAIEKLGKNPPIAYLEYDWSLNDVESE